MDPGKTTGLALVHSNRVIESCEVSDYESLLSFIERVKPQIMVVESFVISYRRRGRDIYEAVKIIGALEFISKTRKQEIKLIMQSPAVLQSKSVLSSLPIGMGRHARSAAIHALAYAHKNNS